MPARSGKRATHCAKRDTGAPDGPTRALTWRSAQIYCIRGWPSR